MSDLRDFIQQHDPTSIGLYLVEFDRLVEQYEGEKARVKWLQSVVDEGETTERKLKEQLETLRNCVEEYADLDNWEAVRSSETTSAWQKRWGHPTPWVDAQEALERVPYPAKERP